MLQMSSHNPSPPTLSISSQAGVVAELLRSCAFLLADQSEHSERQPIRQQALSLLETLAAHSMTPAELHTFIQVRMRTSAVHTHGYAVIDRKIKYMLS